MIEWEWYTDNNVKVLFLHLLLTVNHKEQKRRWENIKVWEKITSLSKLSEETWLSVKQVRLCLEKLKKTWELDTERGKAWTKVKLNNYADYQETKEIKGQGRGQSKGNQRATNNNDNNNTYILYTQDINFVAKIHKQLKEEWKEWINRYVGTWLKIMFQYWFHIPQSKKWVIDMQKRFEQTMIKYIGRWQNWELPYSEMDLVIDKLKNWLDNWNSTGNFKNSIINFLKNNKK